ncbi:hypothetical protein [Nocardia macrotermitis]|uniref:Uncharacterized protein n=1 Tax=Nocardia macrotermitis TaxID=2585198 RepID=A0A7K0D3U5_9NOCA|nr:hypothetical protein [Nocardia macrotermitis]MQY20405.1 hypothetical protein [Nocardia macrotermitis]
MGYIGVWSVTALPDDAIRTLRPHFADDLTEPYPAEMARWRASGGDFPIEEDLNGWNVTSVEAEDFRDLFLCECGDELWDAFRALPEEPGPEHSYQVEASKGDPTAALCYGLGPAATDLLPGRLGDFLLPAAEVTRALPNVEQALAIEGERREQVTARIEAWMTGMVDGGWICDPDELLDTPLGLFRRAAADGLGLLSMSLQS